MLRSYASGTETKCVIHEAFPHMCLCAYEEMIEWNECECLFLLPSNYHIRDTEYVGLLHFLSWIEKLFWFVFNSPKELPCFVCGGPTFVSEGEFTQEKQVFLPKYYSGYTNTENGKLWISSLIALALVDKFIQFEALNGPKFAIWNESKTKSYRTRMAPKAGHNMSS